MKYEVWTTSNLLLPPANWPINYAIYIFPRMKMIGLHRFGAAKVAEIEAGSQKVQLLPPATEKNKKKTFPRLAVPTQLKSSEF